MWIEELPSGKYKYVERYEDPLTGKSKRVSVIKANKTRQTQKEASYILNNKIATKIREIKSKPKEIKFIDLYDEWFNRYKKQVAESTYMSTNNLMKAVKADIGEDTLISRIDSRLINEILDKYLYDKDLSNKYVAIIKTKINLVLKYALRKDYITVNPMDKVQVDYKKEFKTVKIKDKYLEDTEYESIISFTMAHNERYGLLFQWLYLTGMRPGEATALLKTDVDIENATANINGTLLYRERKITDVAKSNRTKTAAGMRVIDLSNKTMEIYQRLIELNHNGEFLFQTNRGTPILITAINTYLRAHRDQMGIPKEKSLSSHIFRHTHISKLAEIGTPMYVIQDRVGHEDSKLTQQIYLHVTQGMREKLQSDLELL
ncbi:tyrosine-type recombinase/integrase [Enterococcus hulanensis]|uniref:Tyrosine-type recombinase/integrase n=1 Tax=Enterococcus hulanensis TaxID=2559929 RepID=A0ABU3EX44_9ENTE|nr:tyrosine-type recombinase/integrase [Enterococcus hulanensis]MDT2599437.1 tyrosine-type recombinase/integrase [Enterococcus hulanensis]MDT2608844.1 tyrosine-type recombinase/integrase [Enterococcus hulanensis]MDT2616599.1 tyrosine-type recombinase/integrase [Enterococcus hulanensis]MDT2627361.1 tyrosine-type recombinase/integrase [Enterococcus hulanensis]MDT2657227.1 tyrosine-type recombinase/integrase [Enterococcus hulanensis]